MGTITAICRRPPRSSSTTCVSQGTNSPSVLLPGARAGSAAGPRHHHLPCAVDSLRHAHALGWVGLSGTRPVAVSPQVAGLRPGTPATGVPSSVAMISLALSRSAGPTVSAIWPHPGQ